ncbi:MAG: YMGG-like glycine zipper-containing protein [Azonexus sp.]
MNKTISMRLGIVAGALLAGACTVMPSGPSVMALPGSNQSIERFREDDGYCRQFAYQQIGGQTSEDAARKSAVTSAAVGTVVGAVAGAALGGNDGAAFGAGAGLLMGSAAGADAAQGSRVGTQRQYDNAYVQCMYAKGHKVPVPANLSQRAIRAEDAGLPPPPPGLPPPPPPGAR